MKKALNTLILIVATTLLVNKLNAQTDVKILDLSVLPMHTLPGEKSDSVKLSIHFKINKANQASKVNLWLGTAKDNSSVFIAQPVFNTVGTTTTFVYNNISKVVTGYEIGFEVALTKSQYDNFKIATLFVETTNGQTTTHLYYQK